VYFDSYRFLLLAVTSIINSIPLRLIIAGLRSELLLLLQLRVMLMLSVMPQIEAPTLWKITRMSCPVTRRELLKK